MKFIQKHKLSSEIKEPEKDKDLQKAKSKK